MTRRWHLIVIFAAALGSSTLAQDAAPPAAPPAPPPVSEPAKEAAPAPAPADPKQDQPQTSGGRTDLSRSRSRGSANSTPAATPTLPERGRDPQWDRYRIVVDRNIFSRQRGAAARGPNGEPLANGESQAPRVEAPPGPPPDPATKVVLIGVSLVGDYATAIFEDRNAGSIIAVQIGEKIMDRIAREITLDGVSFDYKDGSVDVPIGRTLLGGEPPEAAATTATTSDTTSLTSGAATPVSADQKAILERMLQRRREQESK